MYKECRTKVWGQAMTSNKSRGRGWGWGGVGWGILVKSCLRTERSIAVIWNSGTCAKKQIGRGTRGDTLLSLLVPPLHSPFLASCSVLFYTSPKTFSLCSLSSRKEVFSLSHLSLSLSLSPLSVSLPLSLSLSPPLSFSRPEVTLYG